MLERIEELRKLSQALEPTAEQREAWTKQVVGHAEDIFQLLPQAPAFHRSGDEGKGIFGSAIAEEPQNVEELLNLLGQHVETPGVKLGAAGYLAFIPMSTLYTAALGDFLSAAINPYAGNFFASPGAVRLEHLLMRWMAKMVGYPDG